MTKKALYSFLFFLLPLIYFFSLPIEEGDLSVWIAVGKQTLNTNTLVKHDLYSVLPTSDFVYPVLTTLIYAGIDKLGGILAVSIFHKLILVAILFFWYHHLAPKGEWTIDRILIYLLSILGASFVFIDRPALFGVLWFIVLLSFLDEKKMSNRAIIAIFMVNIIWVNTHGSWPILFAILGYRISFQYFFDRRSVKVDLFFFVVLLASTLINPFGHKIFFYVLETAIISKERMIDEWMPIQFSGKYASQGLVFLLMAISSIYFALKLKLKDSVSSCFWPLLLSGFIVIRNTIWPHFAFPILVNKFLPPSKPATEIAKKSAFNGGIVVFLFIVMCFFVPYFKPKVEHLLPENKKDVFSRYSPIKISEYLNRNKLEGAIFNQWELGSFLIYRQNKKIFLDTRNIIYKKENFDQYLSIMNGGEYAQIFLDFNIGFIVFDKNLFLKFYERIKKENRYKEIINERGIVLFEKI